MARNGKQAAVALISQYRFATDPRNFTNINGRHYENKENLEPMRNMAYNERQEGLSFDWIIGQAAKSSATALLPGRC